LLSILRKELDSGIILITHDMAVIAEICDRVAVMYGGNIVEIAEVKELFAHPLTRTPKGFSSQSRDPTHPPRS